jgi:hypothetical protein
MDGYVFDPAKLNTTSGWNMPWQILIVKLNPRNEVIWYDLMPSENGTLAANGAILKLENNSRLVLFGWYEYGDIYLSTGDTLPYDFEFVTPSKAQTFMVWYQLNGNVDSSFVFKGQPELMPDLYLLDVTDDKDLILTGNFNPIIHARQVEFLDTSFTNSFRPNSSVHTLFIARYSTVEKRMKWLNFLNTSDGALGRPVIAAEIDGNKLIGILSGQDSLFLNDSLISYTPAANNNYACLLKMDLNNGAVLKATKLVSTPGNYYLNTYLRNNESLIELDLADSFEFQNQTFPGVSTFGGYCMNLMLVDENFELKAHNYYQPDINFHQAHEVSKIGGRYFISHQMMSNSLAIDNRSLYKPQQFWAQAAVTILDSNLSADSLYFSLPNTVSIEFNISESAYYTYESIRFGEDAKSLFPQYDLSTGEYTWFFKSFRNSNKPDPINYDEKIKVSFEDEKIIIEQPWASTELSIQIFDLIGRLLVDERIVNINKEEHIALPFYPTNNGIYILVAKTNSGQESTAKFIVLNK